MADNGLFHAVAAERAISGDTQTMPSLLNMPLQVKSWCFSFNGKQENQNKQNVSFRVALHSKTKTMNINAGIESGHSGEQKECTSRESNAGPIEVEKLNPMATMDFTTKPLVLIYDQQVLISGLKFK